jgi:hypothetical protein
MLAAALAYTKRPWVDEAWFANISVNILENGKTGISVVDPRGNANMLGREFPFIDREYYVWIPTQPSLNAVWYKLAGFGVFQMRAASAFWGLVVIAAWFLIVNTLTGNAGMAMLASLLISTDFAVLDAASDGRMDVMCAALSYSSCAAYLYWREKRLNLAVFVSQILGVAAGLTHPMGAIGFVTVLFVILYMDRRRLQWKHAALAVAAYAAGVVVIASYVLPNYAIFQAQFQAALTGRTGAVTATGSTFVREIAQKYRDYYLPVYAGGISLARVMIPVLYAAGVAIALLSRRIRGHRGYRTLLLMAIVSQLTMAVLDSGKLYYYLVHSTPYFAAIGAVVIYEGWLNGRLSRILAAGCAAALILLHIGWLAATVRKDPYHRSFVPMTLFVSNWMESHPAKRITASAELGFAIGFHEPLRDDALLGYQSGRVPDLFVFDERSYASHLEGFGRLRPEVARHIRGLMERYRRVYSDGYYSVYAAENGT